MFNLFNTLVKRMTWFDMKLVGLIGIGFGLLLARYFSWFTNLSVTLLVVLIVICYVRILYVMFFKKK